MTTGVLQNVVST